MKGQGFKKHGGRISARKPRMGVVAMIFWSLVLAAVVTAGLRWKAWMGRAQGSEESRGGTGVVAGAVGAGTETGTNVVAPVSNATITGNVSASVGTNVAGGRRRPPVSDNPMELISIANKYLEQQQPAKAIPYYHRARRFEKENEEISFNLGFAYARLGMTNEAIKYYEEALTIYPDYVEANNNLGNLYVELRQFEKANEHFAKALLVMPDHVSALNNFGRCLAAQGRYEEAVQKISQALQLNPNYMEARFNLGQAFMALKNYPQAIEEFNQALRIQPDFALAKDMIRRALAAQQAAGSP